MLSGARPARAPLPGAIEMLGESPAIVRVQELVRRAANLDGCVLITAETGSAVDSMVRDLHAQSRKSPAAFVAVDCAISDPARVERLLFGAPPGDAPTIWNRCRATANSPPRAAARCSCRTSPSVARRGPGSSRADCPRRRSPYRWHAGRDRLPHHRQRDTRNRRRGARASVPSGSVSAPVHGPDRRATPARSRGRCTGARRASARTDLRGAEVSPADIHAGGPLAPGGPDVARQPCRTARRDRARRR